MNKIPTCLPVGNLRDCYATKTDVFLFLDSSFHVFLITSDGDEFVALQQQTHGADFTVYEIARAPHIDACNEACMRGLYFDLNHHLDPKIDAAPTFIAA